MRNNFIFFTIFLMLLLGSFIIASAQTAKKTIEFIDIQGNRIYTDEEISAHLKIKVGQAFDEKQVSEDVKTLFELGYFNPKKTKFITEFVSEYKIGVIFEVYEFPIIEKIQIRGLKYITKDEISIILKEEKIEAGKPYNFENVTKISERISDYLLKRGFPKAKIESYEESVSPTKIIIGFVIDELPEGENEGMKKT